MLVYTTKLSKKKIIGILVIAAVIIAALIMMMPSRSVASPTVAVSAIKGENEVVQFIVALGYEVKEGSVVSRDVVIPKEFNATYKRYNDMQMECGFDLSKYKGKKVTLYTAELLNHPQSSEVLADVLVYKSKAIGGGIYTKQLDGFMYGLIENKK